MKFFWLPPSIVQDASKYKKFFSVVLLVIFFLVLGTGFWLRRDFSAKKAFQEELKEIEQKIEATKERLKEVSELTPEEQAKKEREREILSAQSAEDDVPVEGVEVIKEQKKKVIKNHTEGYRIEMPLQVVIARSISSDWIELHDPATMCEDSLCDPVIRIAVNSEKFPENGQSIVLGGENAYRFSENIPGIFDGYYYYWTKDNRFYSLRISSFDEPKYRDYIATFKFE